MRLLLLLSIISITTLQIVSAQTDSASVDTLYRFSVEEDILTLKVQGIEEHEVIAASRSLEKVFETLTATAVITDEEIRQAGATSIPEALRLAPGIIVRQKSNGYYSVHIREDFNALSTSESVNFDNSAVLLTINHVPMNDLYQGGIFWETLAVDLNDIKRIEVIKTPHSTLYGLNAASGVINIVTKTVESKRLLAQAHLQAGTNETYAHQGSASFSAAEKLRFRLSAFYNSRQRFQDAFYVLEQKRYVPSDSLLFYHATVEITNRLPESSLQNYGMNAYAFWHLNSKIGIDVSWSTQNSRVQSVLQKLDQVLVSSRSSQVNSINLRSQLYNLHTNLFYQSGTQDLAIGYEGFQINSEKLFASTDYRYMAGIFQSTVGGSFQKNTYANHLPVSWLIYNDYATIPYHRKIILGNSELTSFGAYLSNSLLLLKRKFKIQASLRNDYVSGFRHNFFSYQLGATYKTSSKSMARFVYAKGHQGIFIQDYYNFSGTLLGSYEPNKNLQPLALKTFELGYRIKPLKELHADFTLFSTSAYNFSQDESATLYQKTNRDLMVHQYGTTISGGISLNKFKLKAFATLQKGEIKGHPFGDQNSFTPQYMGGLNCTYSLYLNKLTLNSNLYFYDGYTFADHFNTLYMAPKIITNLKLSYNLFGEHMVYFNGKNMLNNQSIEFPYADKGGRLYLIGIDLAF